jgi:UDP:flavonoid glycosyltransferase YjiC (YdhE family)
MRITILAIGSQGDVQPMLALAVGLQHTGRHTVRFAAPDDFEGLAREQGLDFFPLGLNAQALLGTGSLGEGMQAGRNTLVWIWQLLRTMRPIFERLAQNTWLACQDAQAIVY